MNPTASSLGPHNTSTFVSSDSHPQHTATAQAHPFTRAQTYIHIWPNDLVLIQVLRRLCTIVYSIIRASIGCCYPWQDEERRSDEQEMGPLRRGRSSNCLSRRRVVSCECTTLANRPKNARVVIGLRRFFYPPTSVSLVVSPDPSTRCARFVIVYLDKCFLPPPPHSCCDDLPHPPFFAKLHTAHLYHQ